MKVKKVWSEVSLSATSHESCVQTFVSKPVPTLAHFRCPHERGEANGCNAHTFLALKWRGE